EPAGSGVDVGLSAAYGTSASSAALVTAHAVTLTGLTANTTYHYRATSRDAAGNLGASADATFTTSSCCTPIFVPSGGDLQSALDNANPGDTSMLEAGGTLTGNFVLPVKSGAAMITIRSSAPDAALPAASTRIDPSYASQLPKLRSPNNGPALATAAAAHHYTLMFLEFLANNQGYG